MDMTIEFNMDNEAFDASEMEVKRILDVISEKYADGRRDGMIIDINGNRVGRWTVED